MKNLILMSALILTVTQSALAENRTYDKPFMTLPSKNMYWESAKVDAVINSEHARPDRNYCWTPNRPTASVGILQKGEGDSHTFNPELKSLTLGNYSKERLRTFVGIPGSYNSPGYWAGYEMQSPVNGGEGIHFYFGFSFEYGQKVIEGITDPEEGVSLVLNLYDVETGKLMSQKKFFVDWGIKTEYVEMEGYMVLVRYGAGHSTCVE